MILAGTASGMESSVYAVIAIAIAIGAALALGGGNLQFSFYLVALCGMGMLATTGIIVSEDTFGPVSDNAAGIAEMSGEFHGEPERIMVSLDAVGNTTKAVTKGFAIGSAVIAAVALFASFIETAGNELLPQADIDAALKTSRGVFDLLPDQRRRSEGVHRSAHRWRRAVLVQRPRHPRRRPHRRRRRAGGSQAVRRRQDHVGREAAGIRPGHRHLHRGFAARAGHPGVARRAHAGDRRLRHQLLRPRRVPRRGHPRRPADGQLPVEPGGAWDNAKKYIEDGHHGGKGSDPYSAAVIADTVGDPFKDTAGPALNPLIKVMNLVSLLILPAIISLQDNDGARFSIAAAALAVLIGAMIFSNRKASSIVSPTTP